MPTYPVGVSPEHLTKLSPVARAAVLAIEDEHDPLYGAGVEPYLEPCVVALARGQVLTALGRDGRRVLARPDGRVFVGGEEVLLALNAPSTPTPRSAPPKGSFVYLESPERHELGERARRGRPWYPYLRLPGDSFDAAYVFYALVGWQRAGDEGARAAGCERCRKGLTEVEPAGATRGRLFEVCSCQGWTDDECEYPAPPREDGELAREEEGEWFDGAALVKRGLLSVVVAKAHEESRDAIGQILTVGSGLVSLGVTQTEINTAFAARTA